MMNKTIIFLLILMNSFLSFLSCDTYEQADITVVITHPDQTANGKEVIVEIDSNASKSSVFGQGTLVNNTVTIEMTVTGDSFEGDNSHARIIAYLIGTPEGEDIDIEVYNGIPSAFIRDTSFFDRYGNVQSMIYKLSYLQSGGGQVINIDFFESLNVEVDYRLDSYGPPKISWNQYPDSIYYELSVLVKNKFNSSSEHIGNTNWINTYYRSSFDRITDTSIEVYSDFFRFKEGYGSQGIVIAPSVAPGDIFKIEVVAYSKNPESYIYMDTITILYK